MPKNNKQPQPDAILSVDLKAVHAKVFASNDIEEQKNVIKELFKSQEELIGIAASLGNAIKNLSELFAVASEECSKLPVTSLPNENPLYAVKDKTTGKVIGGLSIVTENGRPKYSTDDASNRKLVLEALRNAGIINDYTTQPIELQNKKIAEAQAKGTLPASVSTLFTVTLSPKRSAKFSKLQEEK